MRATTVDTPLDHERNECDIDCPLEHEEVDPTPIERWRVTQPSPHPDDPPYAEL